MVSRRISEEELLGCIADYEGETQSFISLLDLVYRLGTSSYQIKQIMKILKEKGLVEYSYAGYYLSGLGEAEASRIKEGG